MNNRFFADRNDFFKYDFLLELLEESSFLRQLTFVPMLTPDDGRRGGKLTNYPCGGRRPHLYRFLQDCLARSRRDIRLLRDCFARRSFRYTPYRDSNHFTNENRDEYFRSIPDFSLREALVFLDPDNGLEVASAGRRNGDRYVKHEELRRLFARMDAKSVLVVYQHLPRVKRRDFFRMIGTRLQESLRIRRLPMFVSDNRIAFMVLTKEIHRRKKVEVMLDAYAKRHGLIFVC